MCFVIISLPNAVTQNQSFSQNQSDVGDNPVPGKSFNLCEENMTLNILNMGL